MRKFRHEILSERALSGLYRAIPEEPLQIGDLIEEACDSSRPREDVLRGAFLRLFFTYRNPSPGDMTAMDLMLNALRVGSLNVRREFVSTSPDIPVDPPIVERSRGRVRESEEHKGMKRWVSKHLLGSGIPVAGDEVSMLGYEVDVGCLAENVFVECGDTEPMKVLEFLRSGLSLGILQYDSEEILWFLPSDEFTSMAQIENSL